MLRPLCVILLAGFLAVICRAQGHNAAQPQRPPQSNDDDPAAADRGKAVFAGSCGFCHGNDATGARAPDLIRSTLVGHDDHGNLLAPMIRNGRPEKGMPSFSTMKDDQLADIVAFLHHQAAAALHNANVPGDYPLKKLLTGDAGAGKEFFDHSGGCAHCHSVTGDLAGIAKKYSPVDLQQKMIYPAGEEAPKLTATVTFKDGTKYQGSVVHQDEFRIGILCQDGWYRSWERDQVHIGIQDPLQAHKALTSRYTDADVHNLFAYLESLK